MPESQRTAGSDAAAEPAAVRQLDRYRAERAAAQAQVIANSMDRRRFGVAPTDCDSDYEVLER